MLFIQFLAHLPLLPWLPHIPCLRLSPRNIRTRAVFSKSRHLPARHRIRPITRPGKLRRPVCVPGKLLRPDGPRRPAVSRVNHAVIDDPVLRAVGAFCEAGVPDADGRGELVLVEDAAVVLDPVLDIHRVLADQLELAEAVVCVVGACGRVDDEVLARGGVDELLWGFVG